MFDSLKIKVHTILQIAMNFFICALMGIFIWIHTSPLINLNYDLIEGNKTITQSSITFSLSSSISQCIEGRAYGLATLIITFSGIAPYIKLLILLWCWNRPLSRKIRFRLLEITDIINKWAFIDIFAMCLFTTVFSWNDKIVGDLSLKIIPTTETAMYGFCFAILSTNVISQIMLGMEYQPSVFSPNFRIKIIHSVAIILSLIFLLIGIYSPSIDLTFSAIGNAHKRTISMAEATTEIISQIPDIGIIIITVFMSFFSWFNVFIYAGIWLSANRETPLYLQNCISWCTIDVLFASILVTCLELDGIADSIAKSACNFPCFSAKTHIGSGVWYLLTSTICLWISEFCMRISWNLKRTNSLQELPNYAAFPDFSNE